MVGDAEEFSAYFLSGPELTYYDIVVKEKTIRSIKKISDCLSNVGCEFGSPTGNRTPVSGVRGRLNRTFKPSE